MTLDFEEHACYSSMHPGPEHEDNSVGLALMEMVWQAQDEGRVTCGVVDCARVLESDPQNVMLCVMPAVFPDDVSAVIELTLVEACCHEYQIRLIKVDSATKLAKVLQGRVKSKTDLSQCNPVRAPASLDANCVLLQYGPRDGQKSPQEDTVTQHCHTAFHSHDNFNPFIALPD